MNFVLFPIIAGWLQFSYVISLLFAFTFLAVVQLSSDSIQKVSTVCCKMIGKNKGLQNIVRFNKPKHVYPFRSLYSLFIPVRIFLAHVHEL